MCFLAGANSVFTGDTLLTTPNNEASEDDKLMAELGLVGRPAFEPYLAGGNPATAPSFQSRLPSGGRRGASESGDGGEEKREKGDGVMIYLIRAVLTSVL